MEVALIKRIAEMIKSQDSEMTKLGWQIFTANEPTTEEVDTINTIFLNEPILTNERMAEIIQVATSKGVNQRGIGLFDIHADLDILSITK